MLNALEEKLGKIGVSSDDFSELMIRLLDNGVLCRDESKKEAELYDRYLIVKELVADYLSVLRIRLLHEPRFNSLRLFPPGAEVPGLPDAGESFNSGLRERLNSQEVALVLVLRAEYDKALREGEIDEMGQVLLPLEALNLAHRNLLGRALPEGITERRQLFRRLRQLRLVRMASDNAIDDSEAWLTIRPGITHLVTDTALSLLAQAGGISLAGEEEDGDDEEQELER
jgi:hypothetical protein